MANLVIDIGNTVSKIAYANGGVVGKVHRFHGDNITSYVSKLIEKKRPQVVIVSTVRGEDKELFLYLEQNSDKFILFDNNLPLPIANKYKTPNSLGTDRLAGAVAAHALFPDKDCIVIDFGTALTTNFITKEGEFLGGNISVGLRTRFKALHQYTKRLPLVETPINLSDIGGSTGEAIENGVVLGIMFEVEGYINKYPGHIIIFTGGDAIYFAEKLKKSIFVVYNLILIGLAQIADQYAEKKN